MKMYTKNYDDKTSSLSAMTAFQN